jgi:hypothetical protein
MSKAVEEVVEKFGQMVIGQISIAWDTRQTAEQFLEIREQSAVEGDNVEFGIDEFIEYVRSNTSDIVQQTLEVFGQIGLEKEIYVLDAEGVEVEES